MSCRRRGSGIRRRARRSRCAARKRRTTTGTFRSPTCRRVVVDARGSPQIRAAMPELPDAAAPPVRRSARPAANTTPCQLTQSRALAEYFEAAVSGGRRPEGRQQLDDGRAGARAEGGRHDDRLRRPVSPERLAGAARARRARHASAVRWPRACSRRCSRPDGPPSEIVAAEGLDADRRRIADRGA